MHALHGNGPGPQGQVASREATNKELTSFGFNIRLKMADTDVLHLFRRRPTSTARLVLVEAACQAACRLPLSETMVCVLTINDKIFLLVAVGFNTLTGITFLNEILKEGGHSREPKTTADDFSRFGFTPVALGDTCMVSGDHGSTRGLGVTSEPT